MPELVYLRHLNGHSLILTISDTFQACRIISLQNFNSHPTSISLPFPVHVKPDLTDQYL
jgi:hypothetical protein